MHRRPLPLSRRSLIAGAAGLFAAPTILRAAGKPKVAALFAGSISDKGFMEAGYAGLIAARDKLGLEVTYADGVAPKQDLLEAALRKLAAAGPDLVIAHGGQNSGAAKVVAAEFPSVTFVVTQGDVTGPNLASYEVLQEQSAYLAGVLAANVTTSGVVGHMSGIRVTPGLKGRAAYAAGVAAGKPGVKLLTNFSGNQDDNALSRKVATALADAGADVIFTMLNAGRTGAIEVCRERKIRQIGNVRDWTADMPDVFIASAIAQSGIAVQAAAEDMAAGAIKAGKVTKVGLERPEAIRLAMAADVSNGVRATIAVVAEKIVNGAIEVPTAFSGEEFATPA
jgi:basic membrane protein A